jgi:hypothetical protein
MCSNIPASPAYGVYISQLIRYAMASSSYSDFLKCHLHLRNISIDLVLKLLVKRYLAMNRYIGKIAQPTVKRTLSFIMLRDNSSQIIKKKL